MSLATAPAWWVLLVLCAGAALVAYAAYANLAVPLSWRQRSTLVGLRVGSLLILMLFLLRPVSTEPAAMREAAVAILVDASRSMRLTDVTEGRRIDQATTIIREQILPSVETEFQVDVLTLGDAISLSDVTDLTSVEPVGTRSDLVSALMELQQRYASRTIAGVVLVSDGGDTSGRDIADAAAEIGFPVFTVGIGALRPPLDLEVTDVTAGVATVADSVVDLDVSVVSHGRGQKPVELKLLEDGQLADLRRVTPLGDGTPVRTVFQVSPKTDGATLYTVDIDPEAGEVAIENNRRSVLVQPPGRARRLLMVEGAPGYEHTFLKRVWLGDTGLELDAVVRKGQNDQGEHTFFIQGDAARVAALSAGYPVDRRTLFQYDTVILANVEGEFFGPDQLDLTVAFVEDRGGGLLVLGSLSLMGPGVVDSPLETVLPLRVSDRGRSREVQTLDAQPDKATVTGDGVIHPIMQIGSTPTDTRERWERLPPLGGSVALGPAKPGASVLAVVSAPGGDTRPLVAIQRYGRGRSMVFAGEAAWRWKMLQPAADRSYDRFWGQAVRWLSAGASEPVTVSTTGGRAPGDLVQLEIYVRDEAYQPIVQAAPVVRILTPGGRGSTLSPLLVDAGDGRYAASFEASASGVYRVDVSVDDRGAPRYSATEWVLVGGVDTELADPRLDAQLLQRLSDATGGDMLPLADLGTLPERLLSTASSVPQRTRELWHSIWSFLLVVMLLTTEWSLRRAWGLR